MSLQKGDAPTTPTTTTTTSASISANTAPPLTDLVVVTRGGDFDDQEERRQRRRHRPVRTNSNPKQDFGMNEISGNSGSVGNNSGGGGSARSGSNSDRGGGANAGAIPRQRTAMRGYDYASPRRRSLKEEVDAQMVPDTSQWAPLGLATPAGGGGTGFPIDMIRMQHVLHEGNEEDDDDEDDDGVGYDDYGDGYDDVPPQFKSASTGRIGTMGRGNNMDDAASTRSTPLPSNGNYASIFQNMQMQPGFSGSANLDPNAVAAAMLLMQQQQQQQQQQQWYAAAAAMQTQQLQQQQQQLQQQIQQQQQLQQQQLKMYQEMQRNMQIMSQLNNSSSSSVAGANAAATATPIPSATAGEIVMPPAVPPQDVIPLKSALRSGSVRSNRSGAMMTDDGQSVTSNTSMRTKKIKKRNFLMRLLGKKPKQYNDDGTVKSNKQLRAEAAMHTVRSTGHLRGGGDGGGGDSSRVRFNKFAKEYH